MIQKAFIQENGNGRMEPEMADLLAELDHRGIPVDTYLAPSPKEWNSRL